MKHLALLLLPVLLAAGCKEYYKSINIESTGLSDVESTEVMRAERLGEALYVQDTVAAKATKFLLREAGLPEPGEMNGWIVVAEGNGYLTRFIKEDGENLDVVYDVRINMEGDGKVSRSNLRPLSGTEAAMFRARQNAMRAAPKECSENYNTVTLEDPDSDGWLVYVLAATMEDVIVVGGHSRVKVTADGRKIVSVTRLSKSCLVLEKPNPSKATEPTAFYVSHPAGNIPSEIHVYLNYLHGYEVFVVTARGKWLVMNGKISVLERSGKKEPQTKGKADL
jgi:hypothetical protein